MNVDLLHPRDQLVAIMNRIYQAGLTTLSGGNLSIRDDTGDVWITPAGIDKGRLSRDDIIRVTPDGDIDGPHRPSSEYPFHRAIYERRPDLGAIGHAHPPALVSFSIVREVPSTHIIPQAHHICGEVGYAPYALPGSAALGDNIAATFGEGVNVVLLENHGIATGGPDLLTAFQRLETLDFCARTLIYARGLGEVRTLTETELASIEHADHLLPEFVPAHHSSRERELRRQIVDIVRRACGRNLMISTQGVVSARINETDFLITPTGVDRRSLDVEDIVLIEDGHRETCKRPSRSVRLHASIYRHSPEVNAIMTAQSPAATAYAVTAHNFDTRTIPESYILLRDIPISLYGAQYRRPHEIATTISATTPVALIQNDCVLTIGATVLEAFDRLEVAEFSAKALIDTATIGTLVPIGDSEIADLESVFLSG